MNQKMLKKFLVVLLAFNIFTTGAFSAHENDNKITYAQEKQSFAFVISDQSGPIFTKFNSTDAFPSIVNELSCSYTSN